MKLPLFTCTSILPALFASSSEAACRLALLLAIDVSSSVSDDEYKLQQSGLASALLSEDVSHAILDAREGHVALAIYEWSGRYQQSVVVDWTIMDTRQAIAQTATTVLKSNRSYSKYPTAMGYSLGFGARHFAKAPQCDRKVIDVSGDGINNDGFGPTTAYRHFPFEDVTVNGLVIAGSDADVEWFYESEVLLGQFAFLEVAAGFSDFERTMTRKLFREISNLMIGHSSGGIQNKRPKS